MSESPTHWSSALDRLIADRSLTHLRRALVVAETPSTQDAARELCAGIPGLALVACRQTHGRARLGRAWHDAGDLGLAATIVLDAAAIDDSRASIAAGLAACRTAEALVAPGVSLGLRWPNDVVTADSAPRKLAGVLIEHVGGLLLVGIGLNVLHAEGDFPADLRPRAVSLAMLGSNCSRIDASLRLLEALDNALTLEPEHLIREWSRRDLLVGTRQTFLHNGRRVSGLVEAIAPTTHIRLRSDDGATILLPALTTSLVHPQ